MNIKFETCKHIFKVQELLVKVLKKLQDRLSSHDKTKLGSPEAEIFETYTEELLGLTYGSREYFAMWEKMKPAFDHHYQCSSHHPEFHKNGVSDMSLIDLIEMVCDWKAATLRHKDGDIKRSIEINQQRFNYGDELKNIFLNTLKELQ
jgi:hypothetical protein